MINCSCVRQSDGLALVREMDSDRVGRMKKQVRQVHACLYAQILLHLAMHKAPVPSDITQHIEKMTRQGWLRWKQEAEISAITPNALGSSNWI